MAAAATMAAAGFDKRASTASSLHTPGSGTFPSELLSPMASSPGYLRKDDLRTPITPPSAYLDFLNKMSPAIMSPAPSSTSTRFTFGADKSFDKPVDSGSEKPSISPPPSSHPPLSRNSSHDSTASHSSTASVQSAASSNKRPESPRIIIPPSQFAKPGAPRSARTPRRLHIPQSPAFSPALGSAHSVPSPYSSTPLSAAPWSASFSPRDYDPSKAMEKAGKVSVRQVVTRTVTYCRTPLEPAPKGKRRKIEVEEVGSSQEDLVEPLIKHEKIDEEPEPMDSTATAAASTPPTPAVVEPTKDA